MPIAHLRRAAAAGAAALLLAAPAGAQSPLPAAADYTAFADSLRRLVEQPARSAPVASLVLQRDRGTVTLEGGRLYLLPALGGREIAAVYAGPGRVRLAPEDARERFALERRHDAEVLETQFDELVLLFADRTPAALAGLAWEEGADVPGPLERRWREALDFASGWDQKALDPDVALPLMNGVETGFFYAHMGGGRLGDPIVLQLNPSDAESVQLLSRGQGTGFTRYMETTTRFRPAGAAAPAGDDRVGGMRVRHYTIAATLDRTGAGEVSFEADAALDLVADKDAGPWVALSIYGPLEVDSAQWSDGSRATVIKPKDAGVMWVKLDRRIAAGEERALRVWYGGDLVDRFGDWFYINATSSWYPRPLAGRRPATFDITFRTPSNYRIASVGRMADSTSDGRMVTTRWVAEAPMRNAGFSLGIYEDVHTEEAGAPPVTLLWSERGHKALTRLAVESGGQFLASSNRKEVASDVSQSLKFFSHVFGPLPLDRLYASEIPGGHGEAFPGLIHLSWGTFFGMDNQQGVDEWFRAHEVAHQWWGIGVDFASYRDQWLSEGFSSFAGLWYLQTVRRDNERYFKMLDGWRRSIAERSAEAGPISLGYRTATAQTGGDYQTVVYYKGAWVLHMLRIMMLDLRTMNEDLFTRMMQEYYSRYRGGQASTEDFRAVVEKYMGRDMGWFFDQWVHGTAIPTYRARYETSPLPDGQVKMTVHVTAENVPDDFQAYVPVTVALEGDRVLRTRVRVVGRETSADLPALPGKPVKFTFNDFEGVLATVKK